MARRAMVLALLGAWVTAGCDKGAKDAGAPDTLPGLPPQSVPGEQFMVEGPWGIGEPVHEVLTMMTLRTAIEQHRSRGNLLEGVQLADLPEWRSAYAHNLDPTKTDKSLHQFIRGCILPDDPEGLFYSSRLDASRRSSGLKWRRAMQADPKVPANLTARSHFGDLQYFHSMTPDSELSLKDVHIKVLAWAGFLADVATGRTRGRMPLSTVPAVAGLFPSRPTVAELTLLPTNAPDLHVRQRAAGALLHLLQDSHCPGHTRRSETGAILAFRDYSADDHDKVEHARHDSWGRGATLRERITNTIGAAEAIAQGAELLALLNRNPTKQAVIKHLREEVFPLAK